QMPPRAACRTVVTSTLSCSAKVRVPDMANARALAAGPQQDRPARVSPGIEQELHRMTEIGAAAVQRGGRLHVLRRNVVQYDDVRILVIAGGKFLRDRALDHADAGLDMLDQRNQVRDDHPETVVRLDAFHSVCRVLHGCSPCLQPRWYVATCELSICPV